MITYPGKRLLILLVLAGLLCAWGPPSWGGAQQAASGRSGVDTALSSSGLSISALSNSGLSYWAAVAPGRGLVVTFSTNAGSAKTGSTNARSVRVKYRVPVKRVNRKGASHIGLKARSATVSVKRGTAKIVLPLDAVSPRARAGGAWVPITVTQAGPAVTALTPSCALLADGTVRCWGRNLLAPVPVQGLADVRTLTSSGGSNCALVGAGSVRCWGLNGGGELGDGTTTDRATPVAVVGVSDAAGLSEGVGCAVLRSGSAKCWGTRLVAADLQSPPFSAREIPEWFGATAIFVDSLQACAILAGGTVSCLYGTYDPAAAHGVVLIPGITGATKVVRTQQGSCALLSGGSVKCWADPALAEWDPRQYYPVSPVSVTGLRSAVAITSTGSGACAVLAGGTGRCWGVGDPNFGPRGGASLTTSVRIPGLSGATAIAGNCALIKDGTVRCWGGNWEGWVGDGTSTDRSRATRVAGLTGVTSLVPGVNGGLALRADGTVRAWGSGGSLGDGTKSNRFAPVVVTGLGSAVVPAAARAVISGPARAHVIGSLATLAGGRVAVSLSTDSTRVDLTWRTAADRVRHTKLRITGGSATYTLPRGAHTVIARAHATAGLAASRPVILAEVPATGSSLAPTQITLAGSPPVERTLTGGFENFTELGMRPRAQFVVDGTGAMWVGGQWQLTRLDPATGAAHTWTVSDDMAFGQIELLAPAAGAGVWLVAGDRVRHFDGQRFVTDLQVPTRVYVSGKGPRAMGHIHDLLDSGTGLWLSLHDVGWDDAWVAKHKQVGRLPARRIARYSAGTWHVMSTARASRSGWLALDRDGAVWAGGWTDWESVVSKDGSGETSELPRIPVSQWARGKTWRVPGRAVRGVAGKPVPDPTGGLWLLTVDNRLLHYRAGRWRTVVKNLSQVYAYGWVDGSSTLGEGTFYEKQTTAWLAVTPDGAAWLAGPDGLWRFTRKGEATTYGPEQGLPYPPTAAPVSVGDTILVLDAIGVLRLDGDGFTRVWTDPLLQVAWVEDLLAVSATEAWVRGEDPGSASRWFRTAQGTWAQAGQRNDVGDCPAVLATDGAVWTSTPAGLTRFDHGIPTVVAPGVTGCPGAAGPNGSVWQAVRWDTTADGTFVAYHPDGTRTEIPRPAGPDKSCSGIGSTDGQFLVTMAPEDCDDDDPTAPALWDGTHWTRTWPAGATNAFGSRTFTDDGALWLIHGDYRQWSLVRYQAGQWQVVYTPGPDETLSAVRPAPGGRACAASRLRAGTSAIICFNPAGRTASFDSSGLNMQDYSVAPDGTVWLQGRQVAKLGSLN